MTTLSIKNMPAELYNRLQKIAGAKNYSLSKQIIEMLSKAINEEYQRNQIKVLISIRSRRFKSPQDTSASFDFLREDRRR